MLFMHKTTALPSAAEALPGRATPIPTATTHFVNGRKLQPPYPAGLEQAVFGLGCFWGAERKFWELGDGIYATAVGYAGGHTANPTYEEVCSGRTGHTEVVLVVFDPKEISYRQLLEVFQAVDMSTELFEFRGHTRIKQMQHLLATRQIDDRYYWIDPPGPTGVAAPAGAVAGDQGAGALALG